ncbi:MAG TPA: hypothetical protein VHD36_18835 [Pirellulales bacterium]|nr:hypothetical protein [Pirellulales bacterium]
MQTAHTFTRRSLALRWILAVVAVAAAQAFLDADAKGALTRLRASGAAAAAADPSCAPPVKNCCPEPCIRYVDRTCGRTCCDNCKPPIKTVLKVVNPVTCCPVDVPVCLPACCEGCPAVDSKCGLLCRGVVTYDWCCGYRVVVRFDRCGDVTVVYRG